MEVRTLTTPPGIFSGSRAGVQRPLGSLGHGTSGSYHGEVEKVPTTCPDCRLAVSQGAKIMTPPPSTPPDSVLLPVATRRHGLSPGPIHSCIRALEDSQPVQGPRGPLAGTWSCTPPHGPQLGVRSGGEGEAGSPWQQAKAQTND